MSGSRRAAALRPAGCLAVLAIVAAGADARAAAAADDEPAVTPYRPTVSTPAALSAPGWLELEAGWQRVDVRPPNRRDSVPYSLKLALSEDWGVRIGGESWVNGLDGDGRRVSGGGDTSVIVKRRFAAGQRSAFGLELGVTVPTAAAGRHSGSGSTDYGATGIFSVDLSSVWHADLNAGLLQLGSAASTEGRLQSSWAAALADALSARWGIVGELSGARRTGTRASGQLLLAATYGAHRRVTLDLGVARGTTSATAPWTLFMGATVLLTRLY